MKDIPKLSHVQVSKYKYEIEKILNFAQSPRPHYSMAFILNGHGNFFYKNETISVSKNDIIFIPIGSTHLTKWLGNPYVEFISIHFTFEHPSPFGEICDMNIQKISSSEPEHMLELFNKIRDEYANRIKNPFHFISIFFEIMGAVYPQLVYKSKAVDERVKKAAAYIQNNYYNETFSNEFLARLCNMSVSHFYFCFKESYGMSPIEYKNAILIDQAKLMLLEHHMKIEKISEALGFNSTTYFRRLFKKITGMTPTEYQKHMHYTYSNGKI